MSPCFPTQNDSFPNRSDPLCSKCNSFVWRDWSGGENFIFVLRSNLILFFSFRHQASTYVNYTGICSKTPCWATLGQITLLKMPTGSPWIVQYGWSTDPLLGKACVLQKSQRLWVKTGTKRWRDLPVQLTQGCAVNYHERQDPSFASLLVSHSLKIRIKNLFTDYCIFLCRSPFLIEINKKFIYTPRFRVEHDHIRYHLVSKKRARFTCTIYTLLLLFVCICTVHVWAAVNESPYLLHNTADNMPMEGL